MRTLFVNVISHRMIREFGAKYPDARTPLDDWYRITRRAEWKNLMQVRAMFPTADFVDPVTIFNIGGNKYRLIAKIDYKASLVLMKYILTHAEYDKGAWKK